MALLAHAACLVGNSSAGIKECSFLGTPVVNIGARQQGRLTAEHVTHVGHDATEIGAAIATQLAHGRYEPSHIYFKDNASETIVNAAGDHAALHAEAISRTLSLSSNANHSTLTSHL